MGHKQIIIPVLALLLTTACDHYSEYLVRGTLYADSTITAPLANKTLEFREGVDTWRSEGFDTYLGHATTDANGRWAFQYIRHLDNPYQKMSVAEYYVMITCEGDTLYTGMPDTRGTSRLRLYPGCWKPWWRNNEDNRPTDPEPEPEQPGGEEGGEQ